MSGTKKQNTQTGRTYSGDLGLHRTPAPSLRVGVLRAVANRQPSNRHVVQPRLDAAVGTQVVLEACPCVGRQRLRRRDAVGRQVRKRSIIRFAVVHEDLGLASDAQVLVGSLSRVGHGDEGYVRIGESLACFPVKTKELAFGFIALRKRKEKKRYDEIYLHVGPHIDIATGYLACTNKDMAAETACTIDTDRVLARMCCRRVQGDFAALVAVGGVHRPCSLVPSILEALRHLGKGGPRKGKDKESGFAKHCLLYVCDTERMGHQETRQASRYLCSLESMAKLHPPWHLGHSAVLISCACFHIK